MAKTLMTNVGKRKICRAHAGDGELAPIVSMAIGRGGIAEDGSVRTPTGKETELYGPLIVKRIEKHAYMNEEETTCRYTASHEKNELAGEKISELGLIDSDGDLVAYKTFAVKEKDGDMKFIFDIDEIL